MLSYPEHAKKAHSDKPATPPPSLAQAFAYGEAVKKNYESLTRKQENFRRDTAVAVIAAGATTLFYTVTGGASQDVLAGTAIGGAGLYLTADILTSRLEQEIFQLGYEAVNCTLGSYGKLYGADAQLAVFVPIGNETSPSSLQSLMADVEAAAVSLAKKHASNDDTFVNNIAAAVKSSNEFANAKAIISEVQQTRVSLTSDAVRLQNRIDEIQNQAEMQRGKIGNDPLSAARNPFQLILTRTSGFANAQLSIPTLADGNAGDKIKAAEGHKPLNDLFAALNASGKPDPRATILSNLQPKLDNLAKETVSARNTLVGVKDVVETPPEEAACTIPDQSSKLVLKTAPSTEIKIPRPQSTESAKLTTIRIIDNAVLGVMSDWVGDTPRVKANDVKVPVNITAGQQGISQTTVGFETTHETTTGTYSLYIVDTLGRFSTTIKVEIE